MLSVTYTTGAGWNRSQLVSEFGIQLLIGKNHQFGWSVILKVDIIKHHPLPKKFNHILIGTKIDKFLYNWHISNLSAFKLLVKAFQSNWYF